MTPPVQILLATYNGERYLAEQLDSLISQTYRNWTLIIRDDGSTDGTRTVISRYRERFPGMIQVIEDGERNLGARGNFARLMENSRGYVMFCDQDDVWLPEKIERTVNRMLEIEGKSGKDTPVLVHTDVKVVDERLHLLSESFVRYQKLDPTGGRTLNRLIIQNMVTGCTTMINEKLRQQSLPVPKDCIMHDWWIALVAAAFGTVDHLGEPTMLYRQHGRNDTGAKEWSVDYVIGKALTFYDKRELKESLLKTQRQAQLFLARYGDIMPEEMRVMVTAYATLEQQNFFERRRNIIRYGFYKTGLIRNIGLLMRV